MRADKFFAQRFSSRTKAQEALARGEVLVRGKPLRPSDDITGGEPFEFVSSEPFVSNGGKKLERGLSFFGLSMEGRTVADLGASTGGFTDCLLRRGAKKVFCVDVGRSQLDGRIASDGRVVVMDGVNARYLTPADFSEPPDDVVSDLSFISLCLVLPAVCGLLSAGGRAIVLFKPQFECGGRGLTKRGVLPPKFHPPLLESFYKDCSLLGLSPRGIVNAPISEGKNVEYVVWLEKGGEPLPLDGFMAEATKIT